MSIEAANMHAISNQSITNSPFALKALLEAWWCKRTPTNYETCEDHATHYVAAVRLDEWAQSILGPDMHFRIEGLIPEDYTPTVDICSDHLITAQDIKNIEAFTALMRAAGESYLAFVRTELSMNGEDPAITETSLQSFSNGEASLNITETTETITEPFSRRVVTRRQVLPIVGGAFANIWAMLLLNDQETLAARSAS